MPFLLPAMRRLVPGISSGPVGADIGVAIVERGVIVRREVVFQRQPLRPDDEPQNRRAEVAYAIPIAVADLEVD